MNRTGYVRGFLTREAAEDYQMRRSLVPAFCSLHPACRGRIVVTDPVHHASGHVYVHSYIGTSKAGHKRTYFASYVGA